MPRGGASQSRSSSLLSGNLGYHQHHHRDDDVGDNGGETHDEDDQYLGYDHRDDDVGDDGGDPHDGDGQDLDPLLVRELEQRAAKSRATTNKRKQRPNR